MSLWVSDSSCWRAGVAAARARCGRACVPGGRRDPPGVSGEADATAVTLDEFPPGGRGRVLRACRIGTADDRVDCANRGLHIILICSERTVVLHMLFLPAARSRIASVGVSVAISMSLAGQR